MFIEKNNLRIFGKKNTPVFCSFYVFLDYWIRYQYHKWQIETAK